VGLVNTDICVSGPIVKPQASPVLDDVVVDGLRAADDPTSHDYLARSPRKAEGRNYYEFWTEWWNQGKENGGEALKDKKARTYVYNYIMEIR